MTTKTDAARLLSLMEVVKAERKRRDVPEKPKPVTRTATIKPATQLASGSPAILDHFRADIGSGYLVSIVSGLNVNNGSNFNVVESAVHESGPRLAESDALDHEMIRDSFGRRDPTASTPQPDPEAEA